MPREIRPEDAPAGYDAQEMCAYADGYNAAVRALSGELTSATAPLGVLPLAVTEATVRHATAQVEARRLRQQLQALEAKHRAEIAVQAEAIRAADATAYQAHAALNMAIMTAYPLPTRDADGNPNPDRH